MAYATMPHHVGQKIGMQMPAATPHEATMTKILRRCNLSDAAGDERRAE